MYQINIFSGFQWLLHLPDEGLKVICDSSYNTNNKYNQTPYKKELNVFAQFDNKTLNKW